MNTKSCLFLWMALVAWSMPIIAAKLPSLLQLRPTVQEDSARARLQKAIIDPEFLLDCWIELPTSPDAANKTVHRLSLREAILLALRYNPNIQNAELDRIIQRYQLRLAHNEFELQYALSAQGTSQQSTFNGVGTAANNTFMAVPEVDYKTKWGTKFQSKIDNSIQANNSYAPVLDLTVSQPLLRGFGAVNQIGLLNAIDTEHLNQLTLQQSVIDQVTQVISSYRALILSANNIQNQRLQLKEANKSYEINEKKIKAGELEPSGNIQQSYQIESLNLMVEQGENDFKTASQDLLQTIGLDPNLRLSVPSDVSLPSLAVPSLEASIQLALCNNVQFIAQKIAIRADERAYNQAKNQQLWQLDLSASMRSGAINTVTENTNPEDRGLSGIYNGHNTTRAVTLNLNVPLRDMNRRSQLISAKVRLEKDRINFIAAKRALVTNVTNTINNIQSLAKRFQLAQKQVQLAEQSYALEKKKLQAGISSALDVNNTQNQLIQAQSGLIGAKIAYLNQLSALQRTLGTTLKHWKIKLRYGR